MSKEASFQSGQIVKLKSGGPDMTVRYVYAPDNSSGFNYDCNWFAGKKLEKGRFPHDTLELIPGSAES